MEEVVIASRTWPVTMTLEVSWILHDVARCSL